MTQLIEKILEHIAYWIKVCEIEINKAETELDVEEIEFYKGQLMAYENTKSIVQEVAKEYDEFDVIYKKVCELEKEYANYESWEDVNRCIRLENLLQYFHEQLTAPYQKGE